MTLKKVNENRVDGKQNVMEVKGNGLELSFTLDPIHIAVFGAVLLNCHKL